MVGYSLTEILLDKLHQLRAEFLLLEQADECLGYTVRATEEPSEKIGYEFAAYSETSPYDALGRLRRKMYRGLATRHITGSPGGYHATHDKLAGRISCDPDAGVLVVVDGVPLGMYDLARILETHEGFGFEIQIVDALE